jgi:hypothetical protein
MTTPRSAIILKTLGAIFVALTLYFVMATIAGAIFYYYSDDWFGEISANMIGGVLGIAVAKFTSDKLVRGYSKKRVCIGLCTFFLIALGNHLINLD